MTWNQPNSSGSGGGGGGGGSVNSVNAGTATTITGPATDPVVNVVFGASGSTATVGDDARLTDARTPTGAAGGDLGGTYASPTVTQARGLRETGGPTTLAMASIADTEILARVGATVDGYAVGSGLQVVGGALQVTGFVPTSRNLTAGAGLTGGGDLSADRTFDVVAGDTSIVVGANSLALGTSIPTIATFTGAGSALSVTNNFVVGGIISNAVGSAAAPSYTFTGRTTDGMYSPAANQVGLTTNGAVRALIADSSITYTPAVATTGSPTSWTLTQPAHTGLTTTVENVSMNVNTSATKQWATGAIATQREVLIQAPTYAFVGASTITTAATLAVSGPPVAGTNATLTQTVALLIGAGQVATPLGSAGTPSYSFTGDGNTGMFSSGADILDLSTGGTSRVTVETARVLTTLPFRGASGSASAPQWSFSLSTDLGMYRQSGTSLGFAVGGANRLFINSSNYVMSLAAAASGALTSYAFGFAANTNQTLSTEIPDVDFAINRTVQWATGALTTQRFVLVRQPTIAFVGASTVTDTASLAIVGAPLAGANATLTRSYALWVQAGGTRIDGNFGMGVAPVAAQTVDAVTNNVTSGGTSATIANFTDLTIYANDAATIRNDIFQLGRSVQQIAAALRAFGLGV